MVSRSLNIVLVLLQQAEMLSVRELASLLVVAAVDDVAERHLEQCRSKSALRSCTGAVCLKAFCNVAKREKGLPRSLHL